MSMPAGTRERGLDAAVELLGAEGVRALTHARVDERAGLPPGSTSNWFRTRRALLGGVVDWIAERERADFAASATRAISSIADLVE
jgi:DNA-binding transcriptional regulator YbjK